jgi:hypothetical protein
MSKVKALIISIILLVLVYETDAACYNYWKGDNLPAFTNTSYCRKRILIKKML